VVLASALLAETLVAATNADAAPASPPSAEEPARGADGTLQAPDSASAQTIARLQGERVEVVGERTKTSSTWALPDGTFASGLAGAPIWVRKGDGDGTAAADWAAVDLTLQRADDGSIRPKAHPAALVLAGAGTPENGALVQVEGPSGEEVALQWDGELPEPQLEGPRATYPDVQPGVDLVIEATRTGYEQFFVLTDRPADGDAPDLSLTVTAEGLTPTPDSDGGVAFTAADGEVVGTSGTPEVWDAEVDSQRQHPVTEPWSAADGPSTTFAPFPDSWGTEPPQQDPTPTGPQEVPQPDGTAPPAAPADDSAEPGEDAGRVSSEAAAKAGASPSLPLTESAQVTAPGSVEVTLTPDAEFLADPDTTFPVVVDPPFNAGGLFDTWVQHGYSTDQSGSTELRLGTFDGGASYARSFINEDLTALRGKQILSATLEMYEWYSYSCQPAAWEVWDTGVANTATRINSQPTWYGRWAVPTVTTGYSASCGAGYVDVDVTNLFASWVNFSAGLVSMGLKAANEASNSGWKKFNSANAGAGIPIVYINYNTQPGVPTALKMDPQPDAVYASTSSATPLMKATAVDPDGLTFLKFRITNRTQSKTEVYTTSTDAPIPTNSEGFYRVPKGFLANGDKFQWDVWGWDGSWEGPVASSYEWTVDTSAPAAPTVTSTSYPSDGKWHGAENQPGNFTLTLPSADPTLAAFVWDLDKTPTQRVPVNPNTLTTTLSATPLAAGRHVLQVKSQDLAGNSSPIVSYVFYVGKGALTSPLEGAQVVRRARLTVSADPSLTYAKFQWRRGPDATLVQDLSLPTLTTADGSAVTKAWNALSDLGDYSTWDAASTLGFTAGPVQVRALLSADSQGASPFETPWVTLTVTPDAQNAATDSVGPGSVNLLTGDYRLSSTDVDEFGLAIGRTASSRDPRAGLEPQQELLGPTAQKASDAAPFNTNWANRVIDTTQWHGDKNSLLVTPSGASPSSFVYPGALNSGAITGLTAGKTYRVSGWIYVPGATGLNPGDTNGLRIAGMYNDGTWKTQISNKPTLTDTWQQLTLDFTVPAGATGPLLRLYNGFSATDKKVYYDDLSVREVWAPFGRQWALGVADQATGTAYTAISQPYPDVAVVHLSEGGEIWFSGAGGNWWPQPGAEGMRLSITGAGMWRLLELDGTISDFAVQPNATDAQLVSTSPPVESGKTRLVYRVVNGQSRLYRMIAPLEAGVDDWPYNLQACTTDTPAAGCEVVELVYADTTTATSTAVGDFGGQVKQVKLWSSPDPAAVTTPVTAVEYRYDKDGMLRQVWDPRIPQPLITSYTYDTDGRVLTLAPPGELPWTFRYGTGGSASPVGQGDLVDRSSGRLYSVSRASLIPGSVDQTAADTTSTVVYNVPMSRADGGPYDLNRTAFKTWAQRMAPTDATAIFGPEDPPLLTTATATSPGPDGYRPAIVHYLDSSGREVNTATPAGPDAPAAGFIDTAEYDQYGNVVRSLDATSRLLALGQLASATTDLEALGLTPSDTASRAMELSTLNTYGAEGLDLLRTQGPLVRLAIGNNAGDLRLVHDLTLNTYDEGKPDGAAYHLATTQTDALLVAGSVPEQLVDVGVTLNRYDPIDGASPLGLTSGWKIGQPTEVVVDSGAGGVGLTARTRYDDHGRVVESRKAGSTGSDAGTSRAVYYTAGANSDREECGNKPGYAGLPCMNYVAGAATGLDSSRMAANLPVKTVTGYNRYGSITAVT